MPDATVRGLQIAVKAVSTVSLWNPGPVVAGLVGMANFSTLFPSPHIGVMFNVIAPVASVVFNAGSVPGFSESTGDHSAGCTHS